MGFQESESLQGTPERRPKELRERTEPGTSEGGPRKTGEPAPMPQDTAWCSRRNKEASVAGVNEPEPPQREG